MPVAPDALHHQHIGSAVEGEKTMRATILAALMLLPVPALADPVRVNALQHSCESLKQIVEENWRRDHPLTSLPHQAGPNAYDRYISSVSYCGNRQMSETMSIPAADTKSCRVRHCVPANCDAGDPFCCPVFV